VRSEVLKRRALRDIVKISDFCLVKLNYIAGKVCSCHWDHATSQTNTRTGSWVPG